MLQIDDATPEGRESEDVAEGRDVAPEESEEVPLRLEEECTGEPRARTWREAGWGHGVDAGAFRCCVACSNPYARPISRPSLHGRPNKVMPAGNRSSRV